MNGFRPSSGATCRCRLRLVPPCGATTYGSTALRDCGIYEHAGLSRPYLTIFAACFAFLPLPSPTSGCGGEGRKLKQAFRARPRPLKTEGLRAKAVTAAFAATDLIPFPVGRPGGRAPLLGRTCVGQASIRGRFFRHMILSERTPQSPTDALRPCGRGIATHRRSSVRDTSPWHAGLSSIHPCAFPIRSGRKPSLRVSMW